MKWPFAPNAADLYIDLGTANTLVVSRDKGIVANEPSVVCYREREGARKAVVAVGNEAKSKMGRTPGTLAADFPLRDGVIADMDSTEAMLKYFINKAGRFTKFVRPTVVISLPYGVSGVEKSAVRIAGRAAGAREVLLIEEPLAAAIGAELPVTQATGSMVIDVGGGTTEIAVISLCGIVHCESIRVGGHAFDHAIVSFIRRNFGLIVGEPSAERLKMSIGTAILGKYLAKDTIRGVDALTGLPREVEVSSNDVYTAIEDLLQQIFEAGRRTLEQTPPDLIAGLMDNGATATGGGSLLKGFAERLSQEIGLHVRVASEPLLAIARGGERAIQSDQLLSRITIE